MVTFVEVILTKITYEELKFFFECRELSLDYRALYEAHKDEIWMLLNAATKTVGNKAYGHINAVFWLATDTSVETFTAERFEKLAVFKAIEYITYLEMVKRGDYEE